MPDTVHAIAAGVRVRVGLECEQATARCDDTLGFGRDRELPLGIVLGGNPERHDELTIPSHDDRRHALGPAPALELRDRRFGIEREHVEPEVGHEGPECGANTIVARRRWPAAPARVVGIDAGGMCDVAKVRYHRRTIRGNR